MQLEAAAHTHIRDGILNLLVLGVEDVLDELDVVSPVSHLVDVVGCAVVVAAWFLFPAFKLPDITSLVSVFLFLSPGLSPSFLSFPDLSLSFSILSLSRVRV